VVSVAEVATRAYEYLVKWDDGSTATWCRGSQLDLGTLAP
jgi:hypothetical protein